MDDVLLLHSDVLLRQKKQVRDVVKNVPQKSPSPVQDVTIRVEGNGRIRLSSCGGEENKEENIDIQISGKYRPFVLYLHTESVIHNVHAEGAIGVTEKSPEPVEPVEQNLEMIDTSYGESMSETSKTHRRNQSAGFVVLTGSESQTTSVVSNPTVTSAGVGEDVTVYSCCKPVVAVSDSRVGSCQDSRVGSCQDSRVGSCQGALKLNNADADVGKKMTECYDEIDGQMNDLNVEVNNNNHNSLSSEQDRDRTTRKLVDSGNTSNVLVQKNIEVEKSVDACRHCGGKIVGNAHRCTHENNTPVTYRNKGSDIPDARMSMDRDGQYRNIFGHSTGNQTRPCEHSDVESSPTNQFATSDNNSTRCHINIRHSFVQLLDRIYLMDLCDHMYQNYVIDMEIYQLMFEMKSCSKERDAKRQLLLYLSKRSINRQHMIKSLNDSAQYQLISVFFPEVLSKAYCAT